LGSKKLFAEDKNLQHLVANVKTDYDDLVEGYLKKPELHPNYKSEMAKYLASVYNNNINAKNSKSWDQYWTEKVTEMEKKRMKLKIEKMIPIYLESKNPTKKAEDPTKGKVEALKKHQLIFYLDKPNDILDELLTIDEQLGPLAGMLPLIKAKLEFAQKKNRNPLDTITQYHIQIFTKLQAKLDKSRKIAKAIEKTILDSAYLSISFLIKIITLNNDINFEKISIKTFGKPVQENESLLSKLGSEEEHHIIVELVKITHRRMEKKSSLLKTTARTFN